MSRLRDIWLVLQGRLSSRELQLEVSCNDELAKHISELNKSLREMDQLIYQIVQVAPAWSRVQPLLAKANEHVTYRMNQESKRVGSLVRREIERAYGS